MFKWLFKQPSTADYWKAVGDLAKSDKEDDRETVAIIGAMNLGVDPFLVSKEGQQWLSSLSNK